MQAIAVVPGSPGSGGLVELPEPRPAPGELLVEPLALGVCGTDREIVSGAHGSPPAGAERLILGHELIGRVRRPADEGGIREGDLVAGIVRRPDPVPCRCCARGEWDMCRNGRYRERGIKELDGYGAELVTLEEGFAVPVDPALGGLGVLTEPASVLAKAWERIDGLRESGCGSLTNVLVTGAGPIGLLAALLGAMRGLELHVLDRVEEGPKPALVRDLGGTYHTGPVAEACREVHPDIVVECTGVAQLVVDAVRSTAPGAVVCLTGVSPSRSLTVDIGSLNNELVLENDVVLGSVNAGRRHFEQAARALSEADRGWLERLITRRVPLERWRQALDKGPEDVKAVVEIGAG